MATRKKLSEKSAGTDITKLLKKDHSTVKRLFDELEATNDRASKRRKAIIDTIRDELLTHARLEEEIFYPALAQMRAKDAKRLAAEAYEEHGVVKMMLAQITDADPVAIETKAKMKVLKDLVMHHVKEEEKEIFGLVKDGLGDKALMELGARFEARKQEMQSHEELEEEGDLAASRRGAEDEGAWESA
ncbi:hemerythrin domain-containing protein [Myxococcota bacterium]|nr:hemerythrin domain-containing protein [Myxococcota bacterium]